MSDTTSTAGWQQDFQHLQDEFKVVDLHPDLEPYVTEGNLGRMLKHPLVIQLFFNEHLHGIANRQYEQKRAALERAVDEQEWHTYVWLHERPFRLDAFRDICGEMSNEEYWSLLAQIWIDTESLSAEIQLWREFLHADIPGRREHFMDDTDRAEFDALPRTVKLYRGVDSTGNPEGLSWTTNRERAEWFAKRFGGKGRVFVVKVNKSEVIASLHGRGESEVIIDPASLNLFPVTYEVVG